MPEHWRKSRFLGVLSLVTVAAVMMVATDVTVAAPITSIRAKRGPIHSSGQLTPRHTSGASTGSQT